MAKEQGHLSRYVPGQTNKLRRRYCGRTIPAHNALADSIQSPFPPYCEHGARITAHHVGQIAIGE